jgi:hypothetical protein
VSLDKVVEAFNAIKAARQARQRAHDEADLALEEDQIKLKQVMLHLLNQNGATSIVTEHGTAYRRTVIKPSAADWNAIWQWMKDNDAADLLERRLKVGFLKTFMEENDGALPPGINVHKEFEVSVRRPNTERAAGSPRNRADQDDDE